MIKTPEPSKRFEDIRRVSKTHAVKKSKFNKFINSEIFKFGRVFMFSCFIAYILFFITGQSLEIMTLKQQIKEREQSTFLVLKDGNQELRVAPELGKLVKYKGIYVNREILEQIDSKFGDKSEVFKAILIAESGSGKQVNANTVNHNCRYDKKGNLKTDGTGLSNFCKSSYHAKIGTDSVDCGYLQINFKGNKCPVDVFTPEKQVQLAYEIYSTGGCGGLNCWSSYKYKRSYINNIMKK